MTAPICAKLIPRVIKVIQSLPKELIAEGIRSLDIRNVISKNSLQVGPGKLVGNQSLLAMKNPLPVGPGKIGGNQSPLATPPSLPFIDDGSDMKTKSTISLLNTKQPSTTKPKIPLLGGLGR